MDNLYDTSQLLAQAAQLRLKAELAEQPSVRENCLLQAQRFEDIVKRSLEVPPLQEAEADIHISRAPLRAVPANVTRPRRRGR